MSHIPVGVVHSLGIRGQERLPRNRQGGVGQLGDALLLLAETAGYITNPLVRLRGRDSPGGNYLHGRTEREDAAFRVNRQPAH